MVVFRLKGKENVRLGGRKKWILIAGNSVLENKHISIFIREVGENAKYIISPGTGSKDIGKDFRCIGR